RPRRTRGRFALVSSSCLPLEGTGRTRVAQPPGRLFPLSWLDMSSRSALSVVEQQYGSLEELAYHILENKQDALDETLPLAQRAEMVGLPMLVFARILQDPMFRQILRADL